jgi:signal transduction histidine kinase
MNALIPRSLRWQIVLALFAIVLITVAVSWVLAIRFTARDFEAFVTAAAVEQAREYALLLEAEHNMSSGASDPVEYPPGDSDVEFPLGQFEVEHHIEVEYGMSSGADDPEEYPLGDFDRESVDPGLADADVMLGGIDGLAWDELAADELGLPLERYWREIEEVSPAELAERYGSSSDALVGAIMQWEVLRLDAEGWLDDRDAVFFLSVVRDEVEGYVEGWADVGFSELEYAGPLLHNAPILLVDADGEIVFDGSGGEAALHEVDTADGIPIRDWETGEAVGYVLPARERWEFDVEESMFLDRTQDGLLIGGLIAAAAALVFGVYIARRISKPIVALRESAAELAAGGSVARLPVTVGEVGSMSAAFNAMADSLEQQREVRSRMVSDLSHELNTPLSVIRLELEALRDGMQPADEAVERVLREVDLLRNLAADVGLLAENEAGLLMIQKEAIDLTEFLPVAAGRWQTQADAVGIDFEVTVPETVLPVEADPTRLSQALGNLIRNALQHTPAGSTIEIVCARRSVERFGGIWNTICVHDSGAGIAPEDLDQVFERSVRGRANRTGRGLGLTIVRQIVEAHDGQVWAESTVDVGSSFCIALP